MINKAVIPTKAKPRGGIFARNYCIAIGKCVDPSTSLRFARDDKGCLKRTDKLKFIPFYAKNRELSAPGHFRSS